MPQTATNPAPFPAPQGELRPPRQPIEAELLRRCDEAKQLRAKGYSGVYIAGLLNVTNATVYRWCEGVQGFVRKRRTMPKGEPANTGKPHEGRPPVLTDEHLKSVWKQHRAANWTGPQFSAALQAAFGVTYSPRYCADLLRRMRAGNQLNRYTVGRRPPREGVS